MIIRQQMITKMLIIIIAACAIGNVCFTIFHNYFYSSENGEVMLLVVGLDNKTKEI